MKKVEITHSIDQVDWSKPQWVSYHIESTLIVLTNGIHEETKFTGTCLPCNSYPDGIYSENWSKELFVPLNGEIPFIISNKD